MNKEIVPVAVIVVTRNEEENIEKCLLSIHGFVNEIYVIDSDSQDRTVAIAQQYADKVYSLPYEHGRIIPWIFQWGLDNLPIRSQWIMLLEADQEVTIELKEELKNLFSQPHIPKNGFYIRRKQIFRGRWIRFGGYGSKYLLKLFRYNYGELDAREEDTHVYVRGKLGKLKFPIIESNLKENDIIFYLQKHLRYAQAVANEELQWRKMGWNFKHKPSLFGTSAQRALRMRSIYYRMPLYIRAILYFFYRYFLCLGFLDGKEGFIFHFLQAFWFRLIVDIKIEELKTGITKK